MPATATHQRFRKVLDYIDAHLDEDLTLEHLSRVAAFSKYHFHRQFAALMGMGVHEYVRSLRMKRAAYRLAFRGEQRITDIALASGYDAPDAFSRAFKRSVGQSPARFREQPQWDLWAARMHPLSEIRRRHAKATPAACSVRIVDVSQTRVALLEHRGDPRRLGDTLRKFIQWRKQQRLPPARSATFNILYHDPATTPPERYRFGLCAATERDVADNPFGVIASVIPGGRCAVVRHVGLDDTLLQTITPLYADWLPQSGEDVREFPLYLQRVSFFPEVPEHAAETDVFLPLAG